MNRRKELAKPMLYSLIVLLLALPSGLVPVWGVLAAPPAQEDIAIITSPPSGTEVRGTVQIAGSADHPQFQFYNVDFAPAGTEQWQLIGESGTQPVLGGILATWDTTPLPDGDYTLRLRVVRVDGNYNEDSDATLKTVTVANTQPIATPTPIPDAEETPTPFPFFPTNTPTPLPPTATVLVDQPVLETPTPRPVETSAPLQDPDQADSLIPEVQGFSILSLRDACLYGAGITFSIFLFFGFLSTLRMFISGFRDRMRGD